MEAILKIGGSLAADPACLKILCQELSQLAKTHEIAVVPGGAEFADTVRKFDEKYGLSKTATHKMAILAMDQYGLFLSDITPDSYVCYGLQEIIQSKKKGRLPIFLPSQFMFRDDSLEKSWNVTSDTIAAYIAKKLCAEKVVLVKDVDGIFLKDPKAEDSKLLETLSAKELQSWNKATSVDKALPKMLLENKMQCYVVNGKHLERIRDILENKKTVYTKITV
jgi:5-(aminomethyl)-3-furanmethanol phosphate kinase